MHAMMWHEVPQLALVMSPSGRINLVADIRMEEGDAFDVLDVLLIDSDHNRRQMTFGAFGTVNVISIELAAVFNLLKQFPTMERIG